MNDSTIIIAVESSIDQSGVALVPYGIYISSIFNKQPNYAFWSCNNIKAIAFKVSNIYSLWYTIWFQLMAQ